MVAMSSKIKPFENKIALITGSGRGIGRTIALHFASLGADLVVNFFRNREPAEETAVQIREMGRRAQVIKANIGEIEQIQVLFNEIQDIYGGLDYLIHNAASGFNRPVMEQRPKGWDWSMNINARSLLFMAQRATKMMEPRGGGAIVSISSPGGVRVLPDYVSVGASKAALESLTRYLAIELSSRNIVVNAISPGIVLTEALQHFDAIREDENLFERAISLTPAGRLVTPQDIANLVAFLCTPEAEMIRGQVIIIDGGYTLPVPGVIDPSSFAKK
jgi:enoyl-[acyl-carrier protein] reductase III